MTQSKNGVDVTALRRLYSEDTTAKALLEHFAERERNYRITPIERLMANLSYSGNGVGRGDLVHVLRKLEEMGCGKFFAGRRGKPSRFKWDVGMVGVGQAATGEAPQVEKVAKFEEEDSENGHQIIEHKFQLRPDLNISLSLPKDFNNLEAARLASFIRTLPFEATGA